MKLQPCPFQDLPDPWSDELTTGHYDKIEKHLQRGGCVLCEVVETNVKGELSQARPFHLCEVACGDLRARARLLAYGLLFRILFRNRAH